MFFDSPMKSSIRAYCNEGHDVLTALDMRDALTQHPVKGTTTAESIVDESKNTQGKGRVATLTC